MNKFTWYNGLVDVELEAGSLSQEFVDGLDVAAIINRCFGAKEGGDTMEFTDEDIEYMREDLKSGMRHTKMVEATKKKFKAEGRDFDKEFAAYRAKRAEEAHKERLKRQSQERIIQRMREKGQIKGY